jgi:hypothetical protein
MNAPLNLEQLRKQAKHAPVTGHGVCVDFLHEGYFQERRVALE